MQYFITYVLGHRSTSGKKAQLGTIVHKVMEVLASCKKKLQDEPDKKSLYITDDGIGKVNFTNNSLFTKTFVNKILERSWEYYTSNCDHTYNNSDKKFCRTMVDDGLAYNDGQFDPRKRDVVDAEPQFDIPIEAEWAKFKYKIDGKEVEGQLAIKGTIDLVTKIDDQTIEVVDWKTGRRLNWATGEEKTYEKLLEDPQLLLYNYAISQLYPDYDQAIMSIFFIRDGGPFSLCFDKSDQEKFLKMLEQRFKSIQFNESPRPCSANRTSFKCTKLCHFYKNNWPGTNVSMCEHIEEHLQAFGHDENVEKCTREGFNIGYYEAPG
jgi:hypothetical protein